MYETMIRTGPTAVARLYFVGFVLSYTILWYSGPIIQSILWDCCIFAVLKNHIAYGSCLKVRRTYPTAAVRLRLPVARVMQPESAAMTRAPSFFRVARS